LPQAAFAGLWRGLVALRDLDHLVYVGLGRPNIVKDRQGRESIGRFGWKADVANLEQFVADAFRNELGITSPLAPQDITTSGDNSCGQTHLGLDDDGSIVRAVTAYLTALPAPTLESSVLKSSKSYHQGQQLFSSAVVCFLPHANAVIQTWRCCALFGFATAQHGASSQ
jgi:CxxC motif-containing protein (DUF1111 family)